MRLQHRKKPIALNGTPPEVLNNSDLYSVFEPILRADFQMCNTYPARVQPPLACPVTAFGGHQDPSVFQPDLAAWQSSTTQKFQLHFFIAPHHQQ